MAKEGKTLIQFNVKNGKYAVKSGSTWTVKPLTYLTSFSKEKSLNTTEIYGDGEKVLTLINDKGFTGTLGMTAQDEEYNADLGFNKTITGGVAELQQIATVQHALYFETQFTGDDGVVKTKKVWVFGVEAQAPSESYAQNTDGINQSTVEYSITIKGVDLKNSAGTAVYTDDNGNTVKCFTLSCKPDDDDFDTFGDTVPTPKNA